MKSLVFILVASVIIQPLAGQTLSTSVQFEERVYNFGTIKEEKGKISHTFVFQNKGNAPVTIDEVNTGCGCIGKVVTAGPVKPGGKGKVTITFDPSYKAGFFSKEIIVFSNKRQDYSRIWVEGVIEPMEHPVEDEYPYNFGNGLYLRLKVMALGYLKPGETKQMELHYTNNTDKEMTLRFAPEGNQRGLLFANPGKIAPKAKGVVRFSYSMPKDASDDVSVRLFPYVNEKRLGQTVELKALHDKNRSRPAAAKTVE